MKILEGLRMFDFDQFEHQDLIEVTRDLVELIVGQLDDGELDLEYVLHGLVMSIMGLETKNTELRGDLIEVRSELLDLRTQLVDLETRLLNAGVRLERSQYI